MINFFNFNDLITRSQIEAQNAIKQTTEENIDRSIYQIESGIDDLFGILRNARHNNPELFFETVIRFKEIEASVIDMSKRLRSMENIIKLEYALKTKNMEADRL